jgi:phosphatidylglycerophosphatase C
MSVGPSISPNAIAPQQRKIASTLVLFDFDGTITTKDTLIEFVQFYHGKRTFWWRMMMLAPVMVLFLLKLIPNWKAKQFFLSRYFKGEKIKDFNTRCRDFSRQVLPHLIRSGALKAIDEFKKQNHTIAVVSASAENWVKPWCDQQGILCLATRLEIKDGYITGKLLGRNCYGDEKVCRIKEQFDLTSFDRIIAYGDSSGDKEMLALAHHRHYKPWRNERP